MVPIHPHLENWEKLEQEWWAIKPTLTPLVNNSSRHPRTPHSPANLLRLDVASGRVIRSQKRTPGPCGPGVWSRNRGGGDRFRGFSDGLIRYESVRSYLWQVLCHQESACPGARRIRRSRRTPCRMGSSPRAGRRGDFSLRMPVGSFCHSACPEWDEEGDRSAPRAPTVPSRSAGSAAGTVRCGTP